MKYLTCLVLTCLVIFSSCEKEEPEIIFSVTTEDAKKLIGKWMVEEHNIAPDNSTNFTVKEYTTNEMYEKLEGQLFSATSEDPSYFDKQVFIKNNKIYDLLPGFQYLRERDRFNFFVTDLNEDGNFELTFSAFAGSGILYQQVNCFYFHEENMSQSKSTTIATLPLEYEINFKSYGYHQLDVVYNDALQHLIIGEVKLIDDTEGEKLMFEMLENIPQTIKDKVSGQ